MHISIDLETLGTNTDSEIISIGAVAFDMNASICDEFYVDIQMSETSHLNMTIGTIQFWLQQPVEAWPKCFTNNDECQPLMGALCNLSNWLSKQNVEYVWANGTKFDLGMLEYQFKRFSLPVPWVHNADGCMRTLKLVAKQKQSRYPGTYSTLHEHAVVYADNESGEGLAHNALYDAIWQANYITFVYNELV